MSEIPNLVDAGTADETFTIGAHDGIRSPSYLPELKAAEGVRALLNHIDTLDASNPVMVPAVKWQWLRQKNEIAVRTDDDGNEIGAEEIERLESAHPLVYYDPPELYNYTRQKTLVNYIFRSPRYNKSQFERLLREREYPDAMAELPAFVQPFVHAGINRVLEETDGASLVPDADRKLTSTEQAWANLEAEHYDDYFEEIVEDAAKRPSATVIPAVPQLGTDTTEQIYEAWATANRKMVETAAGHDVTAFAHLYLDYQALDPDAGEDTAAEALQLLDEQLTTGAFAGIAITMHHPNRIWQTGRGARLDTFLRRLGQLGTEHQLPVIAPRSEWFGSYATDFGIQAFSSMLNGAWQYKRYSSGGGPGFSDQYGSTMIPNEARALKVEADDEQDLEGYIEANGSLPAVDGLPSLPPTFDAEGDELRERYGTPPEFRRTFGKPRRLAHIVEAEAFREARGSGADQPARDYLRESKNPYVEL